MSSKPGDQNLLLCAWKRLVVVLLFIVWADGFNFRRVKISPRLHSVRSDFDFLVIGGGSGGVASARRAASYGAKVALVEKASLGGTCVNVGCVPKKIMRNAGNVAGAMEDSAQFGFRTAGVTFEWNELRNRIQSYVSRLNSVYRNMLDCSNVRILTGTARFASRNAVHIGDQQVTADNILIAVGGKPSLPPAQELPGVEHCISSDDFFSLSELPRSIAVIGGGYIGVELAGILRALGANTHIFTIWKTLLSDRFDDLVVGGLEREMQRQGIVHHRECGVAAVRKEGSELTLLTKDGSIHGPFEQVLLATGRVPNTASLNLQAAGITAENGGIAQSGHIAVDSYQNTVTPGVHAVGDVCGNVELTPMAIAAGRRLADRLYGGIPGAKADYENVPTVVFSDPPIGACGLTEAQAVQKYGADRIQVFKTQFTNLYYGTFSCSPEDKPRTAMKLITLLPDKRVVGVHMIGKGCDEVLQGFAVAIKMGATKADFDSTLAIHPTAAEELVTMAPWGV